VSGAIERIERRVRDRREGVARYAPILFVALCSGLMVYAFTGHHYETVTEHNIKVLRQIGPNEWMMTDDEEGRFRYRGCDDFPNNSVIWVGYIADHAKWEEQGACKSIRRADLGFWWAVDGNDDVRRIMP
jgi:hypothetical protein